jgi:hypothetical protein
MEANQCVNCGLVNLEGDTRCQRCNDILPLPGQTISWSKLTPPPTHAWMNDSVPQTQPAAPLVSSKLFPCPDCGHKCSTSALSCPQCGRPFAERTTRQQQQPAQTSPPGAPAGGQPQIHYHYPYPYPYPQPQVWSPGVAAVLSLFIPGVGQMYKGKVLEGILWLLFTPIGYILFIIPGLIMHIICIITASQGNPYKQGG